MKYELKNNVFLSNKSMRNVIGIEIHMGDFFHSICCSCPFFTTNKFVFLAYPWEDFTNKGQVDSSKTADILSPYKIGCCRCVILFTVFILN